MAKIKRDKIYVLGDSVYRSEATFLKNIKAMISRQNFENSWVAKMNYQVYDLSQSGTVAEYKVTADQAKVSNERDLQLKTLLDQLDPMDNAVLTIINMYPTLEKDDRRKAGYLHGLNNVKFEIDDFKKYIINNKGYFLNLSNDLEWIKAILTIHNFRDCNTNDRYYDYSQRKYVSNKPTEELIEAFKQAKLELRKDKRKTKK
jgi:hypothetical protein